MTGMAALIFVVLGLGVTLGLVKPRRVGRFLFGLVLGPVLIGIGFTLGAHSFDTLPSIETKLFKAPEGPRTPSLFKVPYLTTQNTIGTNVSRDFIW